MIINKQALAMEKRRILNDIAILLGDNGNPADIKIERVSSALVSPLEATVMYKGLEYHKKHQPYFNSDEEANLPKEGRNFGAGFSPGKKIKLAEYANWMLHGFASTPEYRGFVVQAGPILEGNYFQNEIYKEFLQKFQKIGGSLLIIPPYPGIPGSFYWLIINRVKSWWKIT